MQVPSLLRRIVWFAGLWLAGVLCILLVALAIRAVMPDALAGHDAQRLSSIPPDVPPEPGPDSTSEDES
jgi:hypothetical protein